MFSLTSYALFICEKLTLFSASFSLHLEDNVNKNTSLDLMSHVAAPKIIWAFWTTWTSSIPSERQSDKRTNPHILSLDKADLWNDGHLKCVLFHLLCFKRERKANPRQHWRKSQPTFCCFLRSPEQSFLWSPEQSPQNPLFSSWFPVTTDLQISVTVLCLRWS